MKIYKILIISQFSITHYSNIKLHVRQNMKNYVIFSNRISIPDFKTIYDFKKMKNVYKSKAEIIIFYWRNSL